MAKIDLTEKKAKNSPQGGVLVGKKDGQTIIYDDGKVGGWFVGKTHKEGGIQGIDKTSGQPIEVQTGEVIITAPALADQSKREFEGKMMTNREILSKINSDAGGVSFADGGEVPEKMFCKGGQYNYGGKMMSDKDIADEINKCGCDHEEEKYERGGQIPQSVKSAIYDSNGERKIDAKAIATLTKYVNSLPQTKELNVNDKTGKYTKKREKLHKQIIDTFKKDLVCVEKKEPIAILMGGSPASGKSTFLRKYAPYLLKEEILKVDADEIRSMLPEYKGYNASQTQAETKDIVNTLLSDRTIGIPCKYDIIYDGTMNSTKSYLPLIDLLKKLNYKIFIVYIDKVPENVVKKRALERYKKSGRFVPMEVIDDFFGKGKTALNELKDKADGYMIIDGSNSDYNIIEKHGMNLPKHRLYSKLGRPLSELEKEKFEFGGSISEGYSLRDIAIMHNVPLKQLEKQVKIGMEDEKIHAGNEADHFLIVKDHLFENPNFYTNEQKAQGEYEDGGYVTYKDKYNKKYNYDKNTSHTLEQISKDTGVSMKGLQQIYNKGIGAYKTNPESVRPNVKSKEQWAMARVYSAVMGGADARVDANELKMNDGGEIVNISKDKFNEGYGKVKYFELTPNGAKWSYINNPYVSRSQRDKMPTYTIESDKETISEARKREENYESNKPKDISTLDFAKKFAKENNGKIFYKSNSGSVYVRIGEKEVRISDHRILDRYSMNPKARYDLEIIQNGFDEKTPTNLEYWDNEFKNGGELKTHHKDHESLVRDAKSGNTPARDLNNYNDLLDVQADGRVGGDSGIDMDGAFVGVGDGNGGADATGGVGVFAKGGIVVSSIKDIPNFEERLNQKRITYRGLGDGKLADDFYNLAGESGTRIKVDGKEYFITDKEFNSFSRDENGNMRVRFEAPARKHEDGGDLSFLDDVNKIFAEGGETELPKIKSVVISGVGYKSIYGDFIGKVFNNYDELSKALKEIFIEKEKRNDYFYFTINDTKDRFGIQFKNGKNTVLNFNPITGTKADFEKQILRRYPSSSKRFDWNDFFGNKNASNTKPTSTPASNSSSKEPITDLTNTWININGDIKLAKRVVEKAEKLGWIDSNYIKGKINDNDFIFNIYFSSDKYIGWNFKSGKEITIEDLFGTGSTPDSTSNKDIIKRLEIVFDFNTEEPNSIDVFDGIIFEKTLKREFGYGSIRANVIIVNEDDGNLDRTTLVLSKNPSSNYEINPDLETLDTLYERFSKKFPNYDWKKFFRLEEEKTSKEEPKEETKKESKPDSSTRNFALERKFLTNKINGLAKELDMKRPILSNEEVGFYQREINATIKRLRLVNDDQMSLKPMSERIDSVYSVKWGDYDKQYPETELKSINGVKSELTEEEYFAVRTDGFKSFFGDWELAYETGVYSGVSKIINEKTKEPQPVFHGTNVLFTDWKVYETNNLHYFAVKRKMSEFFAKSWEQRSDRAGVDSKALKQLNPNKGKFLYRCFLDIRNPIDLSRFGVEKRPVREFLTYLKINYNIGDYDFWTRLANQNGFTQETKVFAWQIIRNWQSFTKYVKTFTTYDGYIFYEYIPDSSQNGLDDASLSFCAFESNQIKFNNAVEFNALSNDSRFDLGGNI